MMTNLDDLQVYKELDPKGMLWCLHQLPEQCRQAWQAAAGFRLPADYAAVDKVIITGMGGSAIGGALLESMAALKEIPVFVSRDYDLPPFVDGRTLVIASSYSGVTEETLRAFDQALDTAAKKLVITSGGKLKALAEEKGIPVLCFDYRGPPRAAFGYSVLSLLGIFHRLGLMADKSREVAEMVTVMEGLAGRLNEGTALAQNPAKKLATRLAGHLIVVYGAGILSQVAYRWKTQFNENSKTWAFHEVFPELNHNAVVGYQFPRELAAGAFVILLRSNSINPRTLVRYQLTAELLTRAGIEHEVVPAGGAGPLSQMMSLVLFGDYVSYYLALLNGVDPWPVEAIDHLKEQLMLHNG